MITELTDHSQIRLRFGYTLSDSIHAYRFYYSKTRRYWTDKIFGGILILVSGLFLKGFYDPISQRIMISSSRDFFALLIFFMLAGIAIWFDLASLLGIWSGFRKQRRSTFRQYDFVFDDSGAEYKLDTPESQVNLRVGWTEFSRIMEDNLVILLVTKEDTYWTVPKRHFPNPADLTRFQHLAYSKIR